MAAKQWQPVEADYAAVWSLIMKPCSRAAVQTGVLAVLFSNGEPVGATESRASSSTLTVTNSRRGRGEGGGGSNAKDTLFILWVEFSRIIMKEEEKIIGIET